MATEFEKKILDAAVAAQRFHIDMTGGQYLWESHESFLQNYIAFRFAKFDSQGRFKRNGYCVYVDPSSQRIREGLAKFYRGKTPMRRSRFDLVFWFRSKDKVKAVLEIKRAWEKKSIENDINKVTRFLGAKIAENAAGYVLYYTDCRKNDKKQIKKRFSKVDGISGSEMVGCRIGGSGEQHSWGFALYRCASV